MSQFGYIFTGVLSFAAAIAVNLFFTNLMIVQEKYINHSKAFKMKLGSCLLPIVLFSVASEFRWWWAVGFSTFMVASWFWFVFDSTLATIRHRKFWDSGSEDGKADALTDNFLQHFPIIIGAAIKLLLIFGSTYIYIGGLTK